MKGWRPVDYTVALLASSIFALMMAVAWHSVMSGFSMHEEKSKIVAGIITSVIAIISIYVGASLRQDDEDNNDNHKNG